MKRRVLVVEDDAAIRRGVVDALRFAHFETVESSDGVTGLEAALERHPDLVLLDVMLPRRDGFEVLEALREARPTLPVIMLTARGAEEDRIAGLKHGADDYVVKPFSARELLARVEAVLRRSPGRVADLGAMRLGGRCVDFDRREVAFPDGSRRDLTEREAELLRFLASRPTRVVTRDEILVAVWGLDPRGVRTRTVDMHVARLRERLAHTSGDEPVIETVRGKGYRLAVTPESLP